MLVLYRTFNILFFCVYTSTAFVIDDCPNSLPPIFLLSIAIYYPTSLRITTSCWTNKQQSAIPSLECNFLFCSRLRFSCGKEGAYRLAGHLQSGLLELLRSCFALFQSDCYRLQNPPVRQPLLKHLDILIWYAFTKVFSYVIVPPICARNQFWPRKKISTRLSFLIKVSYPTTTNVH